jgi:hypothetical protein
MADNFNIAKFLKENALGSYGILGKYVDLQPLKEVDKEDLGGWDGDGNNDQYDGKYDDESGPAITNELEKPEQIYTNDWMNDSIEGKKVGAWTCYYDEQQGVIYWLHDKINSEDAVVYATPGWDGAKGIACETSIDSGEAVIDHETIGDSSYPDFESYAADVTPYLNKVEKKYGGINEADETWFSDMNYFKKEHEGYKLKPTDMVSIGDIPSMTYAQAVKKFIKMEGADNFKVDLQDMIDNIKQGYGYIDPEYVEQTWEMSSDISFDSVKDKVLGVLTRLGLLKSDIDEADVNYTSAEEFDMEPQEGPNDPLGPNMAKYPRADFADAVYAANQAGISKDELIRLINQNAK